MTKVLVTGGAGYIGSHTVLELLQSGLEVVVLDNFSNSSRESLRRVEQICDCPITLYQGDILERATLDAIFAEHSIDAVIHFSGLKAVGESVQEPLRYYQTNLGGTLTLCNAMAQAGVFKLVFSSSATVYGEPSTLPLKENFQTGATTSPYATSKYMVERVLHDLQLSSTQWQIAILRYFNPVGAHQSGLIGEDPNDIPNNLMPFISQVAIGKRKQLQIFGDDYDTHDGTGVRDYIHVVDLAVGHLKALKQLQQQPGVVTYNLGTGIGYSVLDMVNAFEAETGQSVPYQIVERRSGDIAAYYSDPSKAFEQLGWQAQRGINEMVADTWRWQANNPNGYDN
ncbi:UDP-glucose 4-epimerase GalE [Ferrimonas lipolytica]|uniref:UDP-glucose 4-epimerase n=1 Tax=Ferrimonas lipolytica TaxID=2724191 RepID=A0A6H1UGG6_9GAMM|nr:UDP-glucose 4-epimerase GalE [Ferrimonas lipolytica]QIZ77306.1 UDP-glucose 4-epimerase GalE [Ferrimonas lipolytica]